MGVKKPILKDDYISYFKGYTLLGSNVCPFGYETVDGFHSELMVLEKMDNVALIPARGGSKRIEKKI